MENLTTLLEIISELRAENKELKIETTSRLDSISFLYNKCERLEKEKEEALTASLS
jgi:hypothetical protein